MISYKDHKINLRHFM